MTTVEVNILADEDQDFVITILNALARKHIIEFDHPNSFPAEGPKLSDAELADRVSHSEQRKRFSADEARARLGL